MHPSPSLGQAQMTAGMKQFGARRCIMIHRRAWMGHGSAALVACHDADWEQRIMATMQHE
jgi:DNA-binding transcriptional regulator YdaS (Cro superfamily)